MIRRLFGLIVFLVPPLFLIGFVAYILFPELLFFILPIILGIDIVGIAVWFLVAGRAIYDGEGRDMWLGDDR